LNSKGGVPFIIDTDAEPSAPPLQLAAFVDATETVGPIVFGTEATAVSVQLWASVTMTE
jgi:hypothetical protein